MLFLLISCSSSRRGETDSICDNEVPSVIFDTDICGSTDDLVALRAIYKYADEGKCNLLGVIVDREGERNASCVDVFNTFYGYADIPVGLVREGIKGAKVWNDYSGIAEWVDSVGNPLFSHTIEDYSSLPDGFLLYSQLLSSAPDKSVTIVSVGFLTALAQLLESEDGIQLVTDKVKALYMMGGKFVDGKPDYNFAQGPEFAEKFFTLWPSTTPVFISPSEVGSGVYYNRERLLSDMQSVGRDPLKEVYARSMTDTTQKMWDFLAVLHAVEGDRWFKLSDSGFVTVDSVGHTFFTPSPDGNFCYQLPGDKAWNDSVLTKIRSVICD
ncbi:MAG: nucleoside hydrolase [Muribaculaceae bacterium]|nr:nucleoside hydrolase [Muribaculaceae bacterium]